MNKFTRGILAPFIILGLAVLAGCNSTSQAVAFAATDFTSATLLADIPLQSGEVAETLLSAGLDEEDLSTVSAAFGDYGQSRKTLESLFGDPIALLLAVEIIQVEHTRLMTAYMDLQGVVEANWDRYDPVAQAKLLMWQKQAYALEAKYGRFLDSVRTFRTANARAEAAKEMLMVALQIAKLVV